MKKKIILLDLGGVVFQSRGISNDNIDWDIIWKLNKKYGPGMDLGGPAFIDFLEEYNTSTKQQLKKQEFLKGVFDTLHFNKELIEFLKGYGDIVIVSDNYPENIEYISKRYNFEDWSIAQFYSFTYKMYKSNPEFFARLLKDLKEYEVDDMIFIDDSKSKIESAKKNSIKGILYLNNHQLKEDLKKMISKY